MGQDVRQKHGNELPNEEGWLALFKDLVDYGKALLTAAGDGVAVCDEPLPEAKQNTF